LTYILKVLDGQATLRSYFLDVGEHLVGSSPEAKVHLDHRGVSRRHARIEVLPDGGVVLTDHGSKNGTFADGRRVTRIGVSDHALLSFGPVEALLEATDGSRADIAILGAAAPGAGAGQQGPGQVLGEPSTQGSGPLDRLAMSLRQVLEPEAPRLPVEAAACRLAGQWLRELPVSRVEIRRGAATGGEAVVALAATDPHDDPGEPDRRFTVGGWVLLLWQGGEPRLDRLRPLFELALQMLAVWPDGAEPAGQAASGRAEPPAPPAQTAALEGPDCLNPAMRDLYRHAGKVARGEIPILILGESGSGKEVLARWIHERSPRSQGPFLAINCAALPRELLEAELFGIERGVATGVEARPGLLKQAGGGTLFLDEIGDMPPEVQAKVLRALESGEIWPLGARGPVAIDVRFLAATHVDLKRRMAERSFRSDLYHRLAAFVVELPPLRERPEDLPALAASFLRRELDRNGVTSPGITRAALGALLAYPWPGNVRELQNEIAKAVLLLDPGTPLDLPHLSERIPGAIADEPRPLTLESALARAEADAFRVALAAAEGDAAQARRLLGVSRTTFYRKLKELGHNPADNG